MHDIFSDLGGIIATVFILAFVILIIWEVFILPYRKESAPYEKCGKHVNFGDARTLMGDPRCSMPAGHLDHCSSTWRPQ